MSALVEGIAAPLPMRDVDTDLVIPAPDCINRRRPHFGEALFRRLRERADGSPDPDFVLNRPRYRDARFLVAGPNFGCGSSREMAVWALQDFGIRCVVAPSFGEIFEDNCLQNRLPALAFEAGAVRDLQDALEAGKVTRLTLDLERGVLAGDDGRELRFELDPLRRRVLVDGLDPVAATLTLAADIEAFERRDRAARPWIHVLPASGREND